MQKPLYHLLVLLPILMLFQACSYMETVKRAKQNENIKGTAAYYDTKCLIAEECVRISAKIILPRNGDLDTVAVAIVVDNIKQSRVIDLEVINFSHNGDDKVSYVFFNLPVGEYTAYVLKAPDQSSSDQEFYILAQRSGIIKKKDLKAYQNSVILDDINIITTASTKPFSYSLDQMKEEFEVPTKRLMGFFDGNVTLDDPIFSHQVALEGLYYPQQFTKKTQGMYRLAPKFKEGSIPLIFVHGIAGSPHDWKYILENLDLSHYTPYVLYYPSGEDFTKLAAQFNAWILSDKIFDQGPGVIIAHSYGGIIVRDASNIQQDSSRSSSGLFISIATPFGGDAKAAEGVKNAPYVIPSWRSIAEDGSFIKDLYRKELSDNVDFELMFTYNNGEEGPSGDGRAPLVKQLRIEAQEEADHMRGFNEDHISILNSEEAVAHINTLLQAFAKKQLAQEQK